MSSGFAENKELDIGEGSAPSEVEKEAAHGVIAGDVGAPATPGVMTTPVEKRKTLDLLPS
jgi:hypothetical protein